MAGLRASLARLREMRRLFERRLADAATKPARPTPDREVSLLEITAFGSNPGNLRLFAHVPQELSANPPLVVALHGCTQDAHAYARGTGWPDLADRFGFVVIFPEQQAANNPKNCFSWFLPGDTTRESGEALSIRQMTEKAIAEFGLDRSQVFITGLSAGGAMASVMLATYPEMFAGGAIIAGLPYGSAASVQEAFEAMFNGTTASSRALGDRVRGASRHIEPWPRISVWHGTTDTVVAPSNGNSVIAQWINVHGLPVQPSGEELVSGYIRRVWNGKTGVPQLEAFSIEGMGHGEPLGDTSEDGCGALGAFFLDVGISAAREIVRFWKLDSASLTRQAPKTRAAPRRAAPQVPHQAEPAAPTLFAAGSRPADSPFSPDAVIAAAFKAAGLPDLAVRTDGSNRIDPDAIIDVALRAAGIRR